MSSVRTRCASGLASPSRVVTAARPRPIRRTRCAAADWLRVDEQHPADHEQHAAEHHRDRGDFGRLVDDLERDGPADVGDARGGDAGLPAESARNEHADCRRHERRGEDQQDRAAAGIRNHAADGADDDHRPQRRCRGSAVANRRVRQAAQRTDDVEPTDAIARAGDDERRQEKPRRDPAQRPSLRSMKKWRFSRFADASVVRASRSRSWRSTP